MGLENIPHKLNSTVTGNRGEKASYSGQGDRVEEAIPDEVRDLVKAILNMVGIAGEVNVELGTSGW